MPFNVGDPWSLEDTLRELCHGDPCNPMFPGDPDSHNDDCPAWAYTSEESR
ncbi:hypothetical protein [Kitasatospora sp. NPDC047058]|uniref:hypothetical protein n=1 Tax=Kitasatospora sp. NPDC047058 TaxID=3155620 RepID=UPI0033CA3998